MCTKNKKNLNESKKMLPPSCIDIFYLNQSWSTHDEYQTQNTKKELPPSCYPGVPHK